MIGKQNLSDLLCQHLHGPGYAALYKNMAQPIFSEGEYLRVVPRGVDDGTAATREFLDCLLGKSEFILGFFIADCRIVNPEVIKEVENGAGIGLVSKLKHVQEEILAARTSKGIVHVVVHSTSSVCHSSCMQFPNIEVILNCCRFLMACNQTNNCELVVIVTC